MRHGFTLVELSIVLVIAAIIVTFGINIGVSAISGSHKMTTRSRLLTIQSALNNYAQATGYLPCPAGRALTPANSNFGTEARDGTTHTTCDTGNGLIQVPASGSPFIYIGAVPVRSLGLPDAYEGDAWGNKFTYAVSGLHVGDRSSYATVDGPITITGNGTTLTTARGTSGNNGGGPAATYVVVSHGADGKGAYPVNGTAVGVPCSGNGADIANCNDNDMIFDDSSFSDNNNQLSSWFDDYIVWGSNALDRLPTANGGPGTGNCGGVCQPWCAACNTPPNYTNYVVCQKTIISTTTCSALCIYGYPSNNVPCP